MSFFNGLKGALRAGALVAVVGLAACQPVPHWSGDARQEFAYVTPRSDGGSSIGVFESTQAGIVWKGLWLDAANVPFASASFIPADQDNDGKLDLFYATNRSGGMDVALAHNTGSKLSYVGQQWNPSGLSTTTTKFLPGGPTASDARPTPAAPGGIRGDDYPYKTATIDQPDPWGALTRECTSFVAWRLSQDGNGVKMNWGDAGAWDETARSRGYLVDNVPKVGSVAQSDAGDAGHVAWVASVNAGGTVTVEEYNYGTPYAYGTRIVPASQFEYIHVRDVG